MAAGLVLVLIGLTDLIAALVFGGHFWQACAWTFLAANLGSLAAGWALRDRSRR